MVPLGVNVATFMGNLLIFFMLFHALNIKKLIRKCLGMRNFSYSAKFNDLMVAAGCQLVQQEKKVLAGQKHDELVKLEENLVGIR
jgi:hypothetical protein